MLHKQSKSKSQGFTIIEVLIVLAIAGLILLIVFLAVPALQRNARNTSRKNDVAGLLGGTSEYIDNNGGSFPGGNTGTTTVVIGLGGANAKSEVKVGYYNAGPGQIQAGVQVDAAYSAVAAGTLNSAAKDYVEIVPQASCAAAGATAAGSNRQFVAVYEIETSGGGYTQVCQSS